MRPDRNFMKKKGLITGLIIEDDPMVCKVLERILHQRRLEPLLATDSHQAQTMLEKHAEELAIAIVDLIIPGGLTGWDIIAHMKQHKKTADIPIIVITGAVISSQEKARLKRQVDAFVAKQEFGVKSFDAILDKLLEGDDS